MNTMSHSPVLPATGDQPAAVSTSWAYPDTGATRDLRLDFMRGFVFLLLFTSHFDYYSLFVFIGWERIGVVSSAETFIALAGVVTGLVFGKKLQRDGLAACTPPLISRAAQIYRINVFVILSIGALRLVPWIDTTAVTTFHDPYSGVTYQLYPPAQAGLLYLARQALLLQCGPHQFQVMGLYAVLFMVTPLVFRMIQARQTSLLLTLSWIIYFVNLTTPESMPGTAELRPTGAQFEYAFPLLAWQLIFIHGIVIGYYKKQIVAYLSGPGLPWIWLAAAMSILLMLFTLNHPLQQMPDWAVLSIIPPDTFERLFHNYFLKYKLGPGRVLNEVVLLIVVYAVLTRAWRPLDKALGWFFIPIGQASLYVFFVHIYLILIISNTSLPGYGNFWINTGIVGGSLLLTWWLIRREFLFRWIPR